jgi:hypothetical protein
VTAGLRSDPTQSSDRGAGDIYFNGPFPFRQTKIDFLHDRAVISIEAAFDKPVGADPEQSGGDRIHHHRACWCDFEAGREQR